MSSFGDFIALSDTCDVPTARIISREVSSCTAFFVKGAGLSGAVLPHDHRHPVGRPWGGGTICAASARLPGFVAVMHVGLGWSGGSWV